MKVVVNIKKVHFYAIAGLLVLFGGMFAVNAFGGVAPSVMGHSVGEIDFSGGFNVPSGNVGVGVASPTQKLDVNGNARISGNVLASTYCDINGANCKTASQMGGSSSGKNAIDLDTGFLKGFCSVYDTTRKSIKIFAVKKVGVDYYYILPGFYFGKPRTVWKKIPKSTCWNGPQVKPCWKISTNDWAWGKTTISIFSTNQNLFSINYEESISANSRSDRCVGFVANGN